MHIQTWLPLSARVSIMHMVNQSRWKRNGYSVPAPQSVKLEVLKRHGNTLGTWVETGTYLGDTTKVLGASAKRVISIEPSKDLVIRARKRFQGKANIEIVEGLSEEVFEKVLSGISGSVCFWLDGHASGGLTHRGPVVTPIRYELLAIGKLKNQFDSMVVFIDDFRGFGFKADQDADYPSRSYLVNWADSLELSWTVEHDIFVAWN
ncbi:MAG: hypothetical protein PHN51_06880 [Candidatus Nanopelagicales bacterium]|nr:hypothetical protein [Candidatus Nanopelagicales bacterium]